MGKNTGVHFFRLNPALDKPRSKTEWRPAAGLACNLPTVLFWMTLTMSGFLRPDRPIRLAFEHFVGSDLGLIFLYAINLGLPVIAFALGLFGFDRRSRKTDLSLFVMCMSLFLIGLMLVYLFGRPIHSRLWRGRHGCPRSC